MSGAPHAAMGLLVLLCAALACGPRPPTTQTRPGDAVRIVAVDVGQGDCSLVLGPDGTTILIDGGGPSRQDAVWAAVGAYSGGRVDHVVVTHYDADHLGGLSSFLLGADGRAGTDDDGAAGATIWDYGDDGSCTTQTCDRYRQSRTLRGAQATVGQRFPLGDAELVVVAVNGQLPDGTRVPVLDENERSVTVVLSHGVFRALLGGDLTGGGNGTADVETPLARQVGRVDVLKVNHHGSETSTNQMALALWAPRAAVLSLGTDNTYCHPAATVVDRLGQTGAALFATGQGITSAGRCGATTWPLAATVGVGDVVVDGFRDGEVRVDGNTIP